MDLNQKDLTSWPLIWPLIWHLTQEAKEMYASLQAAEHITNGVPKQEATDQMERFEAKNKDCLQTYRSEDLTAVASLLRTYTLQEKPFRIIASGYECITNKKLLASLATEADDAAQRYLEAEDKTAAHNIELGRYLVKFVLWGECPKIDPDLEPNHDGSSTSRLN